MLTITGEGLHDLTLGPATSGLGSSVYFTIHDPATNGEEVWEVTAPECACNADPRSQGYWHRQCLGVGLITPGRHGRGPAEAKEPDFLKTLVPAVNTRLQNSIFEFRTCEDGIDTVPPSEPCEKAKKQYTALLLNLESGRLAPGCGIDPASSSCTSSTIAGLIEEIAALINSGTDQNCKLAASCAGAANENDGILPFSATSSPVSSTGSGGLETPGGPVETTPDPGSGQIAGGAQAFSAAPEAAPSSSETRTTGTPEAASEPVYQEGGAGVGEIFLVTRIIEEAADRKTAQAEPAAEERAAPEPGSSRALLMHLSALSSRTSTPEQRRDAENALLTALGGGYEPSIRLQIVEQLIGKIDVAYNSLLARHLEDIRIDARESGDAELARKAGRILERLEPSSGEEER